MFDIVLRNLISLQKHSVENNNTADCCNDSIEQIKCQLDNVKIDKLDVHQVKVGQMNSTRVHNQVRLLSEKLKKCEILGT